MIVTSDERQRVIIAEAVFRTSLQYEDKVLEASIVTSRSYYHTLWIGKYYGMYVLH